MFLDWLEGQAMTGFSVSLTVILKVQVLVSPTPSVTFHWIVVMPFGKTAVLVVVPWLCAVPPLTPWG
ncbi:MAG TPA: hypothetical protein PKY30_15280, partial [Myxococcota bacterium]|nr:hypothetical protein [Myxococcota bacterium]